MTSMDLYVNANSEQNSNLYSMCRNAFALIKNGKDRQAKENFPMEYHFINKYLPKTMDELMSILSVKLELH